MPRSADLLRTGTAEIPRVLPALPHAATSCCSEAWPRADRRKLSSSLGLKAAMCLVGPGGQGAVLCLVGPQPLWVERLSVPWVHHTLLASAPPCIPQMLLAACPTLRCRGGVGDGEGPAEHSCNVTKPWQRVLAVPPCPSLRRREGEEQPWADGASGTCVLSPPELPSRGFQGAGAAPGPLLTSAGARGPQNEGRPQAGAASPSLTVLAGGPRHADCLNLC